MTTAAAAIQIVSSHAKTPRHLVWTVIVRSSARLVQPYVNQYLKGAKLRERGRFCAIQHPSFEEYGEEGLYDIALHHKLPLEAITRRRPL